MPRHWTMRDRAALPLGWLPAPTAASAEADTSGAGCRADAGHGGESRRMTWPGCATGRMLLLARGDPWQAPGPSVGTADSFLLRLDVEHMSASPRHGCRTPCSRPHRRGRAHSCRGPRARRGAGTLPGARAGRVAARLGYRLRAGVPQGGLVGAMPSTPGSGPDAWRRILARHAGMAGTGRHG